MRPLHDPFGLIPDELPGRPRVLLTAEEVERARRFAETYAWAAEGKTAILARAEPQLSEPVASSKENEGTFDVGAGEGLMDHVVAYVLTGREEFAERAASILNAAAERHAQLVADKQSAASNQLHVAHAVYLAAGAFDILCGSACLTPAERDLIEAMLLRRGIEVMRGQGHFTCSNIRTWNIAALMSAGLCLDEREYVHEALYGRFDEGRNCQTFGILHQFSHDVLADGFHWERSFGYHYYTLSAMTCIAHAAGHCGIDLWHLEVDALLRPEGHDQHRDYRPACRKTLKWMYDAPFYFAFTDGSCAEIHDSSGGLCSIEGHGPVYEIAYETYGDPKYAWLLNRLYEHRQETRPAEDAWREPRAWQGSRWPHQSWRFVEIGAGELPPGEFSFEKDTPIGFSGRHVRGSTLLPSAGYVVLRSDVRDENAPCVALFYGPHSAGHQHACALHLSLYGQRQRLLVDAARFGYSNLPHLTWSNQTIAHNTLVVDETSMFPQLDHERQDYQFVADTYYLGPVTDGVLECFYSGDRLKVARASNEAVYDGVRLDRTVAIVDARYVVDVLRVVSDEEHLYDLPTHGVCDLEAGGGSDVPGGLGGRIGYRHFANVRRVDRPGPWQLLWRAEDANLTAYRFVPAESEMFTAVDPISEHGGGTVPRATALIRTRGTSVVFVTVFEAWRERPLIRSVKCEEADPDGAVAVRVTRDGDDQMVVCMPSEGQHSYHGCEFEGQLALTGVQGDGSLLIEVVSQRWP